MDALEELSKTRPPLNEPDVFALALQKLYEHDVLSDEGILAWGASSTSPLRNSPQVGALLAFLEDDDELEQIGKSYGSGSGEYWNTAAVKERLVVELQKLVRAHKARRDVLTDSDVDAWMAVRALGAPY